MQSRNSNFSSLCIAAFCVHAVLSLIGWANSVLTLFRISFPLDFFLRYLLPNTVSLTLNLSALVIAIIGIASKKRKTIGVGMAVMLVNYLLNMFRFLSSALNAPAVSAASVASSMILGYLLPIAAYVLAAAACFSDSLPSKTLCQAAAAALGIVFLRYLFVNFSSIQAETAFTIIRGALLDAIAAASLFLLGPVVEQLRSMPAQYAYPNQYAQPGQYTYPNQGFYPNQGAYPDQNSFGYGVPSSAPVQPVNPAEAHIAQQKQILQDLLNRGVISQEDYEQKLSALTESR